MTLKRVFNSLVWLSSKFKSLAKSWVYFKSATKEEQLSRLMQTKLLPDPTLFSKYNWVWRISWETPKMKYCVESCLLLIWLGQKEALSLKIEVLGWEREQRSIPPCWLLLIALMLWEIRQRRDSLFHLETRSWRECWKTHWVAIAKQSWLPQFLLQALKMKRLWILLNTLTGRRTSKWGLNPIRKWFISISAHTRASLLISETKSTN